MFCHVIVKQNYKTVFQPFPSFKFQQEVDPNLKNETKYVDCIKTSCWNQFTEIRDNLIA